MIKTLEITIKLDINLEEDDDQMEVALKAAKDKIKNFNLDEIVILNVLKNENSGMIKKLDRLLYLEQMISVINEMQLPACKRSEDLNNAMSLQYKKISGE